MPAVEARLRIATFNIRCAFGESLPPLIDLLARSGADVIALQECWDWTEEQIRRGLGREWTSSRFPDSDTSNAILSRHPLAGVRVAALDEAEGETRTAVIATVEGPEGVGLKMISTHLDQRDEALRLSQWERLHRHAGDRAIVCGDLNALRRADYGDAAWNEIARVRATNQWEAPASELLARIADAGLRDAFVEAGEDPVEGTCRYGTRIDYILHGPRFPGRFVPGSYRRWPAIENKLSDHDLITVDVALSSDTGNQ